MVAWWSLLPRFDSFAAATINTIDLVLFVFCYYELARRWRRGVSLPLGAWVLCAGFVSYDRIYLPIGPAIVLIVLYAPTRKPSEPQGSATP